MPPSDPIRLPPIAPFATFSLFQAENGEAAPRLEEQERQGAFGLDECLEISTVDARAQRYRPVAAELDTMSDPVRTWVTWYVERRRPPWLAPSGGSRVADASEDDLVDSVHQLVVVLAYREYVAIYASEDAARAKLERKLLELGSGAAFKRVEATSLHAAFANSPALTLWLRGLHRPTDRKASRKTLFGSRLQRALNPLDDQTYHYSAARCLPEPGRAIGISPARARVWLRSVRGMDELAALFEWVVDALRSTPRAPGEDDLLEVLASPLGSLPALSAPSELAIFPPDPGESAAESDEAVELRDSQQRWAEQGTFEISPGGNGSAAGGPAFHLLARLDGEYVAELDVKIESAAAHGVRLEVTRQEPAGTHGDTDTEVVSALLRNPDAVVAWFDTGHTLSGGALFATRHRDIRFRNWRWARLPDAVVEVEKPMKDGDKLTKKGKPVRVFAPENVGDGNLESLFDWVAGGGQADVLETGGGWLLCDDGSLEVADFVHLDMRPDTRGAIPILQLIHAKGASSSSPKRKLKVTDYEVVVAQAEKNLRWLEPRYLASRLRERKDALIAQLFWKGGKKIAPADPEGERETFLHALEGIRQVERRVVILQPSMRKERHEQSIASFAKADLAKPSADLIRVFHLDHLLLNLELGCRAYGADACVVGHDR